MNLDKIEKAIDILMGEKGYFWCILCNGWVKVISYEKHFKSVHIENNKGQTNNR